MKIGFDIDGVLANFVGSYRNLLIRTTGIDRFKDKAWWESWYWDLECGYDKLDQKNAFDVIAQSRSFWYSLRSTMNCSTLALCIQSLEHEHDVYYITNRQGPTAKRQTEAWLSKYLPYPSPEIRPTVLIASDKAAACKTLGLDAYIDDNYDNIVGVVMECKATRAYLLDQPWNKGKDMVNVDVHSKDFGYTREERPIIRVPTLGAMLDAEQKNL